MDNQNNPDNPVNTEQNTITQEPLIVTSDDKYKLEKIVCWDCGNETDKVYYKQKYCNVCRIKTPHTDKFKPAPITESEKNVLRQEQKERLDGYREQHALERERILKDDNSKLADLDYIKLRLKNEDLQYYLALKKKWVEEDGLPEGPLLNKLLFFGVTAKNLEIEYLKYSTNQNPDIRKKSLSLLKALHDMIPKIEKTIVSMKEMVELSVKTKGIHDLIESVLGESEKFIKEHVGEHSFKCGNCNSIVGTDGLPHWAIQGKYKHHVFSPMGWKLFVNGKITLAQLAYILMTSPEGVVWTAQERGDKVPENIDLQTAEIELKEYQSYE